MARKSKQEETQTEAAKPSEVTPAINAAALKKLLKIVDGKKGQIDTLTGELREEIGFAKEKKNLHTGVFALIRKLRRMDVEKLAAFMNAFEHMYDISGLKDLAASATGNLDLDNSEDAEEGEEEGEAEDEKVTRPSFGQSRGREAAQA